MSDDPEVTMSEHRVVGRCRECRAKLTAAYQIEVTAWAYDGRRSESRAIIYADGSRSRVERYRGAFESLRLYCPTCRARVSLRPVAGQRTGQRCDARCLYAIGPDCECNCGGDNHGAGLAAALTAPGAQSAPTEGALF